MKTIGEVLVSNCTKTHSFELDGNRLWLDTYKLALRISTPNEINKRFLGGMFEEESFLNK